ncbi:MAG: InlB B-repeat-containing protein [archaeon]|nr:InlB B-repeat-containing protein [archaeon]
MNDHTVRRGAFTCPAVMIMAVLAVMLFLVPASSSDGDVPVKIVLTGTSESGVVDIIVDENPGVVKMKLSIDYNRSAMVLKQVVGGGIFDIAPSDISAVPYTVDVEGTLPGVPTTVTGTLVRLVFELKDGAYPGQYPVYVKVEGAVDSNMDPVAADVLCCVVGFDMPAIGDVNGDGKVNVLDSLLLRKYLSDADGVSVVTLNADINGDGKINALDSLYLRKYLAGHEVPLFNDPCKNKVFVDYCGTMYTFHGVVFGRSLFIDVPDSSYTLSMTGSGAFVHFGGNLYRFVLKEDGCTVTIADSHVHNWEFSFRYEGDTPHLDAVCSKDPSHRLYDIPCTVNIDYGDSPTCTGEGHIYWGLSFEVDGVHYDHYRVLKETVPAFGHSWTINIVWSDDHTCAYFNAVCSNDPEHTMAVEADVDVSVIPASCETNGTVLYVATAEVGPIPVSEVYAEYSSPLGHIWGETVYEWDTSGGKHSCTASVTCTREGCGYVRYGSATVTTAYNPAGCETPGSYVYTATFSEFPDVRIEETIPPSGHSWSPSLIWSEDHTSASIFFECIMDHTHARVFDADVTSVTVPPTCDTAGSTAYTVHEEIYGILIDESYTETAGPLGHLWGETVYEWGYSDGKHNCTATVACTREGCDRTELHIGSVVSEVYEPCCETAGSLKHTALFPGLDSVYIIEAVEALGHDIVRYPAKAATSTEKGWDEYDACTRCDYTTKVEYGPIVKNTFTVTVFGGTVESDGVSAAQTIEVPKNTVVTIKAVPVGGKTFGYWSTHQGDLSPAKEGDPDCTLRILVNQDTYVTAHYTDDYTYDHNDAVCVKESVDCADYELYMIPAADGPGYCVYYTVYGKGHDYLEDPFVELEPTCTEEGSEYRLCETCGHKEYYTVCPKGHTFDSYYVSDEAHGSHIGTKTYVCDVCGETEDRPYISAELPSGDISISLKVWDTYFGNSSTVTRNETHYSFKVTDGDGVVRQTYIYYVYHPNTAHYDAKYETWFLWIDYGDHSPVYICRNQYNNQNWAYDESHYADNNGNKWGIAGYVDSQDGFLKFIDGLHLGHDNGANASVMMDTLRQWEKVFNTYGPDYFKAVSYTNVCGYECTVYMDIHEQMYYVVNEDNCCLQYHPVSRLYSVQYTIELIEPVGEFTSLYDLTGAPLGNIPTKDIVHFYHFDVVDGVDLTEDRIVMSNGVAHYCYDVDDLRVNSKFRVSYPPSNSYLVGWQIRDIDGNWVDIATKYYSGDYYMFDEKVYGSRSAIDVYAYLASRPELGNFAPVSSPGFSDIVIRPVYEKYPVSQLTAVDSSFQDPETYLNVTEGDVYLYSNVYVRADVPRGMTVDHWVYTIDGVEQSVIPYDIDGEDDIGCFDGYYDICIYIRETGHHVITAVLKEDEYACTYELTFQATEGGYIVGGVDGTYYESDEVYVTAVPYYGYMFVGWYKLGEYDREYLDPEDIYGYHYTEEPECSIYVWESAAYTAVFAKTDVSTMSKLYIENGYVYSEGNDVYLSAIYRFYSDYDYLYADPSAGELHRWEITGYDTEKVHLGNMDYDYAVSYMDGDVYVVGVFEPDVTYYHISFDPNGGTGEMDPVCVCEDDAENYRLPGTRFTKENYDFVGWSTDKDATEPMYYDGGTIEFCDDMVLYAVWRASSHSVYISVGNDIYGYSYFYSLKTSYLEVTYGVETYIPALESVFSTRYGFDVTGWMGDDGNVYSADGTAVIPYSVNILEAVVEFWTVYVVFDANGGSGSMPMITLAFDGHQYLDLGNDMVYFTKTGYTLSEWYTDPACKNNRVASSCSQIIMSTLFRSGVGNGDTVTLYAKWTVQYYNIVYCYDSEGTQTYKPSSFSVDYGGNFDAGTMYSRPGYKVVAWNSEPDGSGNSYTPGAKIDVLSFVGAEYNGIDTRIKLYAVWAEV